METTKNRGSFPGPLPLCITLRTQHKDPCIFRPTWVNPRGNIIDHRNTSIPAFPYQNSGVAVSTPNSEDAIYVAKL